MLRHLFSFSLNLDRKNNTQIKKQPAPNNLAHRAPAHPPSTSSSSSSASSGDPESAPSYYGGAGGISSGVGMGKPHQHHSSSTFGGGGNGGGAFGAALGLPPALDARTLDKMKDRALSKARAVQSSLISAVKSGSVGGGGGGGMGAGFNGVGGHGGFSAGVPTGSAAAAAAETRHFSSPSSSSTLSALSARIGKLCDSLESSRAAAVFCRACVASYFVHLVAEDVRAWKTVRPTSSAAAANAAFGSPKALAFPLVSTFVVLPSALLVVLGRFVAPAAALLALEMLWKSTRLLYIQFLLVFAHGRAPTELLAKKVAMVGVAALLAVHPVASLSSSSGDDDDSLKGSKPKSGGSSWRWRRKRAGGDDDNSKSSSAAVPGKSNSFAGPPMLLDAAAARLEAAGIGRSVVLLAGRLLVCALLLTGGLAQLRRVSARGWRPWRRWAAPSSVAFEDGHDNNFLLLELALAIPYALGWRVPEVTRMLSATLFAEACVCWPVWRHWPNP